MLGERKPHPRALVAGVVLACWGIACSPDTEPGTDGDPRPPLAERPNWHEDIAPLVHARCVGCHHEQGVAPFSLERYASAAQWAELMAEATQARSMPPWGAHETEACQPPHAWVDDRRLGDADIERFTAWAELGAPEGDPALAAPLPDPPDTSLTDASAVFEVPATIEVPPVVDSFACVSIDPGLDEDVWVTGVELLPDKVEVIHHALLMLDPSGETGALAGPDGLYPCDEFHLGAMLGSYFPGSAPTELPADLGVPFPVGARVVIAFHYHPSAAGGDLDRSSLALRWTTTPPGHEVLLSTLGNATTAADGLLPGPNDPDGVPTFAIPAGAADHTETMQLTLAEGLPDQTRLFLLGPHMHEVGTQIQMSLARDGQSTCLIHDPGWDADWQSVYVIEGGVERYPTLEAGDVLTMRCTYDNSLANPSVVEALAEYGLDAPIAVKLGSAGLDEMCMFVYGLAIPRG